MYKKKIAYLDYSHIFAGAERVLHTIIENIGREEFEPILVFPYPMPHHENYKDLDCKKIYLSDSIKWWMGSDRWKHPLRGTDFINRTILGCKLASFLKKEKVDILHVNLLRSDSLMWILPSRLLGIKVIGHFRSHSQDWVAPMLTQKCCNLILCVSNFSKDVLLSKGKFTITHVVYDSIEVNKFKSDISQDEAKHKLGFVPNKYLISSIGQLSIRKGHDNAIKALSKLTKDFPQIVLFIAGGGDNQELTYLKTLAKNLNIFDKVVFSEKQISNINEVYRASDLVLSLTKDGEAFGLVPYEATLLGTPFIGPNKGAIKEFINDGVNGILVDTNNIDIISEKIKWCINNPIEIKNMSLKAYQIVMKNLTPDIMINNIEKEYRALLL